MKRDFTLLMAAFVLAVCMMMPLGVMGQTSAVQQLTNANIVSAGDGQTGYRSWVITDGNSNSWNAYAIKNQHSNATSGYHYLQIRKYGSNTAYYIQVPELGTKITSITMTVSGASQPMNGGGNSATLYFSSSNSTSSTGTGVASGTGASSVTINCSNLNLNTGYITADGAVRIWDVSVTYTSSGGTTYTVTLADDNTTLTQASPGASVTLPSRSDIDVYTFAGWSETNVDVETITAPTIIPAGSYTPTADITFYPVYTRTEGGETTTEWRLTNLNAADAGVYALLTTDGHAFNGTISKGHGQITTDSFSFADGVATIAPTGVCEITFVSVSGGFKMYNADKGYLYASAASSGNLAWHNSENSYWLYGSSNWKYNANNAFLRSYDNSSFRTYGTNNGDVLKLAKKVEVSEVTTYYWSNPGTSPIITFTIPDVIAYNANSGAINYTITNPVTGISLVPTILTGGDWISNVDVTTSQVTFDVSTNTTNSDRTGSIKLSYQGAQDKTVTITQGHLTVVPPTFDPEAGTYTTPQNVTLSCATSGAIIHYTTDGSTPTSSSATYSSAIPVSATTTIKAVAVKEGVSSEVATALYAFVNPDAYTAAYTINTTTSVLASGTVPSGSSASFVNTYTGNKVQLTAGNSMTLTLSGYQGKVITGVVLSMHSNSSKGAGSLSITAGSSSLASISGNFSPDWYSSWTTDFVDVNVPMTDDDYGIQSGEQLVITIAATANSLYCESFTIQYEDDVNPRIIVTVPETLAYDATDGAFGYSISNPVPGTNLQATSDADWISDIQVGDSQVTFNTTVNNTSLERSGTITLTYGTVTKTVTITQAALVPVITISDAPAEAFSYEGGNGSFGFSIDNSVDGAIVTAFSAEYWIRDIDVSDGTVSFEVAPSNEDARSGNITLSYMLNGVTMTSVMVPISQEANPYDPGTMQRPYTVTEAWTIINSMGNGVTADNSVYVTGTISQIEQVEVIQYHNANYHITDGQKNLYVRYGKNLDDTDFYDEDELQVGDRVVICGKLQKNNSSPKYRIAEYNYLVSLERDVEPPLFFPPAGMMGNGEDAIVYLESYNNEEVIIHYTMDDTTPDRYSPEYDVENAISLEGETGTITIQAIAYTTDYTKHSAVNSATYIMVPPDTPGLESHPYTVQEALDALESSSTITGVYVSGIVSRDPEFSLDNYMNANYYIADNIGEDELYVYHGRSWFGEPFTSEADLQYGDMVTVYGDLKIYYGVKEFDAKNYIYDLVRPASVSIRPSEVSTNCRGISSSLTVTYNSLSYISSRELQFCDAEGNQVGASTYSWLTANVNTGTGNIDFQIEANDSGAPRTAYLQMVLVSGGNTFVSNIVTITQNICSEEEFATLPFHYVGNETTVPVGITSDGLGENYDTNPRLNFNSLNDYMTLAFDEVPGVLTFDIQADGFKSSMFYLQTSTNNLDWDDLAIYTTQTMIDGWEEDDPKRDIAIVIQNTAMAQSFAELDESVRYIRWIMSTYSSGSKVRLGNIHLAKPVIYYDIVLTQPQEGGTIVCNKETATEGETVELHASVSEGYVLADWDVLDADNNPIMVEGDGTAAYSFTMPASDVTVEAVIVLDNTDFHYAYSINGVEGQSQTATVGTMLTLAGGSDIIGLPFTFVGWSTNANNVENVMSAGTSYKLTRDVTFYAVYVESVAGSSAVKQYVRVMEDLETNWAGDYLIAYSSDIFADGRIGGTDGMGHVGVSVEPGNNLHDNVVETVWGDLYHVTLEEVSAGSNTYLLKTQDGQYNYNSSNNNGLSVTTNRTTATNYPITVNFVSANDIRLSLGGNAEGAVFRYNSQGYFRFYKDCSQEQVYLYKKTLSTANRYTRVFVDNPTGDIVIAGPSIVPNGSVLNVSSITNSLGTDKLVVEEGAQLVTSSNVNATIKKFINPYQGESDNYYLISSPVDGQNPAEADMMNGEFDLYFFNQSAQGEEWRNYEAGTFNLQTGKGYLYANNYGGYITISGPMVATADGVTIENVSGKNFAGWNLIGNPYPCNVTIGNPYYRLAEGGSALATVSTAETVAIAPMEGVFVYTAAEAEVTFTKAPDVSTTGAGRNTLSLRVSRNRATKDGPIVEDNAIVRFGEGSLLRKLVLNPDNAQLYVDQDGTDYAIVNAEAEGELPVSFRAAESGSYTITANAEGVSFRYLHLIDNKTGADADLLQMPTYSFEATTDDYTSRFRLVFSANSVCEDADGDVFAFFNGSQWAVSNEGEATLQVVDVLGRVLSSQVINGDAEVSIYEAQGIYLLRLLSGDSVKVQKIVIR